MKLVIALIMAVFSHAAIAQNFSELDKCSQTLAKVDASLATLDRGTVNALLSAVNSTCLTSVEFSEWANELIYATATAKPAYFINSFGRQPQEIQRNILKALESPIHDGIDLNKAYQAVNSTPESKEKSKVLSAIKMAANKTGTSL